MRAWWRARTRQSPEHRLRAAGEEAVAHHVDGESVDAGTEDVYPVDPLGEGFFDGGRVVGQGDQHIGIRHRGRASRGDQIHLRKRNPKTIHQAVPETTPMDRHRRAGHCSARSLSTPGAWTAARLSSR